MTWATVLRWQAAEDAQLIRLVEAGASFEEMAREIGRSRDSCRARIQVHRRTGALPQLHSTRAQASRSGHAWRKASQA